MTSPKQITAWLMAAAAIVQGVQNIAEYASPTKVEGGACSSVIERLSVALSDCVSRECR